MSNIRERREVLMKRILEGDGKASPFERRAAFNNSGVYEPLRKLIDKVAMHADTVTDEDITAVKVSGLSEDHIFETVISTTAIRRRHCGFDCGNWPAAAFVMATGV